MKAQHLSAFIALTILSWLSLMATAADDSTWRALLNGKDPIGWEANVHPESFTVKDGLLKAQGKRGMSHLLHVGETGRDVDFKDFEVVAVACSKPNSNLGIFFHTSRELCNGKYFEKGYEVLFNSSKNEKRRTGSLYAVVDLDIAPADETNQTDPAVARMLG